ncbi:hypothetical protein JHK82_011526 [Glycine max]|nr:hypothetical protein JHK86_011517 [Glycine max]KAG5153557.1 hypothetical protein JHK82_011526 [Glycine max]KHN15187.1 hypothetical protein glysoja_011805 [Glycine soja]
MGLSYEYPSNFSSTISSIRAWTPSRSYEGIRNLHCESDSTTTPLQFIADAVVRSHPYYPIVLKIQSLITLQWQLHFSHTLREANSCANSLAKTGASEDSHLVILGNAPSNLSTSLMADALGVFFTMNR